MSDSKCGLYSTIVSCYVYMNLLRSSHYSQTGNVPVSIMLAGDTVIAAKVVELRMLMREELSKISTETRSLLGVTLTKEFLNLLIPYPKAEPFLHFFVGVRLSAAFPCGLTPSLYLISVTSSLLY